MTITQRPQLVALDAGRPSIHPDSWIAPNATICGPVEVGAYSSIWYGAVARAEFSSIFVGERTNVQDNCVLHAGVDRPIHIGNHVSVGHSAIIHGSVIGDRVLVGMGSVVMNGCQVGADVLIGAGALLTEGFDAPEGSLVLGAPARVVRALTSAELGRLARDAQVYIELARRHREATIL